MTPLAVHTLAWLVPALLCTALLLRGPWSRRRVGAASLSFVWCGWSLYLLDQLALTLGWWHGPTPDAALPPALLLAWTLFWGPLPLLLAPQAPLLLLAAVLVLLDLLVLPLLEPSLILGPRWLAGDILAAAVGLLPAQLLGRWTLQASALIPRATLHFVQFTAVAFVLFPTWVLRLTGGPSPQHWPGAPAPHLLALVVVLLPGLAAVAAFAERGGGTPVPFDPPPRLVTTGPYAFVANPMQLSFALGYAVLASWSRDPWLTGASAMAFVLGTALVRFPEHQELDHRHGEAWRVWSAQVPAWVPRWRPRTGGDALLLVDPNDPLARGFAAFLEARSPTELTIVRRPSVPGALALAPVGAPTALRGAHAAVRALEHLHLGWAMLGWALGLPGVRLALELCRRLLSAGSRSTTTPTTG